MSEGLDPYGIGKVIAFRYYVRTRKMQVYHTFGWHPMAKYFLEAATRRRKRIEEEHPDFPEHYEKYERWKECRSEEKQPSSS